MQILTAALLILIGVLFFGFIIFFHELGHFLLAKASGIRVNEFALGMGPKLFGFRKGETQYSLRLLPIGGYCAMEGEDEDSGDPRAFGNKPVWKRFLVVAAGGIFNIVLGFFLMMIVLGQQDVFATTQIARFTEGSALQAAGAQVGDTIVEVDGYAIYTDRDLSFSLGLADHGRRLHGGEPGRPAGGLGHLRLDTRQTLEDGPPWCPWTSTWSRRRYLPKPGAPFRHGHLLHGPHGGGDLKGLCHRPLWPQRRGRAHRHGPGHWRRRPAPVWRRALARRCSTSC